MRRKIHWALLATGLFVIGAAGCGTTSTNQAAKTVTKTITKTAPGRDYLYLTIMTGKQVKKPGWPLYMPANFKVPANATVTVSIYNWDDGTAPLPAHSPYATVSGVQGSIKATAEPNGATSTITSLNPNAVSHTFTMTEVNNLNVPIPASADVTFTFKAPAKPGNYPWECMAPCGTGTTGYAGTMATPGWMKGTMTVQ